MSDYYWVFLILAFAFFIHWMALESEKKDLAHLSDRKKRKADDPENVRIEDMQLMDLYKVSKSEAVRYYRKKHGTGLKFTAQLLEDISRECRAS